MIFKGLFHGAVVITTWLRSVLVGLLSPSPSSTLLSHSFLRGSLRIYDVLMGACGWQDFALILASSWVPYHWQSYSSGLVAWVNRIVIHRSAPWRNLRLCETWCASVAGQGFLASMLKCYMSVSPCHQNTYSAGLGFLLGTSLLCFRIGSLLVCDDHLVISVNVRWCSQSVATPLILCCCYWVLCRQYVVTMLLLVVISYFWGDLSGTCVADCLDGIYCYSLWLVVVG